MRRITKVEKQAFLEHLGETGNVSEAGRVSGIADNYVYELRERDAGFARDWQLALRRYRDRLQQEAFSRGVTGWTVPVFYQGKECGEVRRYSDRLLVTLLGAAPAEPGSAEAAKPAGPSEASVELGVKALLEAVDGLGRAGPDEPRG